MFGNLFSLKISLSLFLSQKLNIFKAHVIAKIDCTAVPFVLYVEGQRNTTTYLLHILHHHTLHNIYRWFRLLWFAQQNLVRKTVQ